MEVSAARQVADSSHVGDVRRLAALMASDVGLDEEDAGRVALVATEATSNIVKHAGSGLVLLRQLRPAEGGAPGAIEILALDRGPGIADIPASKRDGYSTAGSPGTGLGAMERVASLLDIYSAPGRGTALVARIAERGMPPKVLAELVGDLGAAQLPARGERVCGDAWWAHRDERSLWVLVADGLGHGEAAAEAAQAAVAVFRAEAGRHAAEEVLRLIHLALRSTRGSAAAIAEVPLAEQELRYVGVGNISASLIARAQPSGEAPGQGRSMVSSNGTVGMDSPRIRVFSYPWEEGSLLVMHTDGVTSRWDLSAYPGLLARDPSLIAGVLARDFSRGRDDLTVVVARLPRRAS
jgi:anti-sigma regulatory factor (Ser/Thr protein kinase)/serine/threonine protein phosphatase PrpC